MHTVNYVLTFLFGLRKEGSSARSLAWANNGFLMEGELSFLTLFLCGFAGVEPVGRCERLILVDTCNCVESRPSILAA